MTLNVKIGLSFRAANWPSLKVENTALAISMLSTACYRTPHTQEIDENDNLSKTCLSFRAAKQPSLKLKTHVQL